MAPTEQKTHEWTRLDVPWKRHGVRPARRRIWRGPVFDAGELQRCVSYLDKDSEQLPPDHFRRLLDRFDNLTNPVGTVIWKLFPVMAPLALLATVSSIPLVLDILLDSLADGGIGLVPAVIIASQIVLLLVGWTMLAVGGRWNLQFYACVTRTMKIAEQTHADHYRLIAAANLAGRAARHLFKQLQGRRRTWVAPPAVADSALSIACPLIDVAFDLTSSRRTLHVYTHFVYYAAGLVVVDRFDLIPGLREYYEREHALARRAAADTADGVPERDALFLDPMRNHHRWLVMKEYLFPLAAWLSLAVSVAALVVSLRN